MTPYYADDAVTLYHGDCREFIPHLAFGAVLTDPPYGIEGGNGGDARDYMKGVYADADWVDDPAYISTVCVPVIAGLVEAGVPMAVTPGVPSMFAYPKPVDVGCFWAPAAPTHGPWGFTTFKPILYYGRDWRAGKGALPSGVVVTESAAPSPHPCPKPLRAWTWLLDKVCEPGVVVLDPFVGSGTTLRAAKDRGRKAIGIEIDESYCELAANACAQEVLFGDVA